jgi:tRNA A37 N6-isopentenylltransferase MiaA
MALTSPTRYAGLSGNKTISCWRAFLSQTKDLIVLHTRQFAKRQRTWFRGYPEIEWFNAEQPDLLEQVWQRVQEFIKRVLKLPT